MGPADSLDHPTADELRAWMTGELSDEVGSKIEVHIESCNACARALDDLGGDESSFVGTLRDAAQRDASNNDPSSRWDLEIGERRGSRIGPYKLLQVLGEGGMGTVWMAHQDAPVERDVALKIIKAGFDTREIVARFEAERQALAMMSHPDIARVLDAGATEAGRPYFAMELVKGLSITRFCDECRMPLPGRIELFRRVCGAVQHAHRRGIIHRDLKPSNILVAREEPEPVVKVIDFGLAKAVAGRLTDKTLFTSLGQMVGTAQYMSPEQAGTSGLDVDTRTDVYSLGVVLYELLTGVTPIGSDRLSKASNEEKQRMIREIDPPAPSTRLSSVAEQSSAVADRRAVEPRALIQSLRGDLDVIVMKALEKEPDRRYESPAAFADDLGRYLANEPVLARPASAAYRLRRLYQRKRSAFVGAAFVALALLVGSVVSTVLAVRATRAERLAGERLAESEEVVRLLVGLFQSPDPSRDGHDVTVAETLDRAVEDLDGELEGQPRRRARLQLAIGKTYEALGLYDEALPVLEDCHAYFDADRPGDEDLMLEAKKEYCTVLHKLDDPRQLESARDYLATAERIRGERHVDTLWAMNAVVNALPEGERRAKREELVELAVEVAGPDAPVTLVAKGNLALALTNAGEGELSLEMREQIVQLSADVHGPRAVETLFQTGNLLRAYRNAGRHEEGLPMAREYVEACRDVYGPEHRDTFSAMALLAGMLEISGSTDEEFAVWESVLEGRRRVLGEDDPTTLNMSMFLVGRYVVHGEEEKAVELARHAVEAAEDSPDVARGTVLVVKNNCAFFLSLRPVQDDDARELALDWAREASDAGPETAPYWHTFGLASYRVGALEDARAGLERSIELKGEGSRSDLLVLAMVLHDLGDEEGARERFEEAGPGEESLIVEPDAVLHDEARALIESGE